jgi:DNA invertase Pin-like site-specific DNA recombinase
MDKRAVIYARVSTDKQANEGISLDMQIARCAEYIEARGLTLLDTIVDAGISAKTVAGRLGFTRIIDMLNRREITHVVTYKLDRAFRNTQEGLDVISLMAKRGVGLHIVTEQAAVKTESADDEFLLTLKLGLAQRERKVIAERTRVALARKREKGERISRYAPFGYCFADGHIEEEPTEQAIIQTVHRLATSGLSIRKISARLAKDGIFNRCNRPFGVAELHKLLRRDERKAA